MGMYYSMYLWFQVEPVVKKGNELYVHHTLLYVCHDTENAHSSLFANEGMDCERGIARRYCTYVLSAWAVGGTVRNVHSKIHFAFCCVWCQLWVSF